MVPAKTKNITINESTLISRKEASSILHCGISSLDSSPVFKSLKRVHIGRHTFFLREDLSRFIIEHREGGAE